jgi:hypothetical protein
MIMAITQVVPTRHAAAEQRGLFSSLGTLVVVKEQVQNWKQQPKLVVDGDKDRSLYDHMSIGVRKL